MKHLFTFLLLFVSLGLTAQEFAIENTRENVGYDGLPTYLKCLVNGYSSKNIRLTTDNGLIKRDLTPGHFVFIPKAAGPANIDVWVFISKKLKKIGSYTYRIHITPSARAMVGTISNGNITDSLLLLMGGLRATSFPDYCTDANPLYIASFSASAYLNDTCLFTFQNVGPAWNDANISRLTSLKSGSKIIFHDILGELPYGHKIKADDLIFEITENISR